MVSIWDFARYRLRLFNETSHQNRLLKDGKNVKSINLKESGREAGYFFGQYCTPRKGHKYSDAI